MKVKLSFLDKVKLQPGGLIPKYYPLPIMF